MGKNGFQEIQRITLAERRRSRYVVAYGSNLSLDRMRQRCPSCKVVGTSVIEGYRLLFKRSMTGAYATIEQDANCVVPVVIYHISMEDELRLDRYEGCPTYYYKKELMLQITRKNGTTMKDRKPCAVYILHEHRLLGEPAMSYFRLLDEGYARYGFDTEILDQGLSASIGFRAAEKYIEEYVHEMGGAV